MPSSFSGLSASGYPCANIQDRELDNKAAIQFIKEQTLDNACTVKSNSNSTSAVVLILYQSLLKHLSIAFQGGDDEANLLVEFYSRSQKAEESEGSFYQ